ncbi:MULTISPECIES: Na/Pi cotransporter family protein [unclassified Marinovum]|uniref:Na/Pi cotransporter family protein n=1 Tax=unclassified Marinovum TaxID=2647166 RepID=UPI003EDBCF7E
MILLAVNLAAAVALLLWSVRMIRTGAERAYLPELRRWLKEMSAHRLSAAAAGIPTAMMLQSATAVALIGSGFAASGLLSSGAALAMILGAELGSALMVQVLQLPVDKVVPLILLVGVVLFLNARSRKAKQTGRITIGVALVFLSLGMIRQATAPIGENDIVQAAAAYFERDLLSAFVIGALLAWLMHSSLAAVLTFAMFAATGLVGTTAAAALVIGANLGGAMIAVGLLWSERGVARQVAVANLVARGGVTLAAFALLVFGAFDLSMLWGGASQQAVTLHVLLNAVLLVLALPVTGQLVGLAETLVPQSTEAEAVTRTALDPGVLDEPAMALACAQRELLRMGETVQAMLSPIPGLLRQWDQQAADLIELREDAVDRMHYETKIYLSQLRDKDIPREQARRAVELVAMANSLEEAADRVAVNLLTLAKRLHDKAHAFSDEGLRDIEAFHDQVATNTRLALSVLTTGDAESARQLVAEKDRIRREEQKLQERHLTRLGQGNPASIATTNAHQETLRLLKQVNAAISYVAYPIAEETGDLLASRLARPKFAGKPA